MEKGSYLLIKRGMHVVGEDGAIGTVSDVIADYESDVFRGIVVSHGLILPKQGFVSADSVVRVDNDAVQVSVTKQQADHLPLPDVY